MPALGSRKGEVFPCKVEPPKEPGQASYVVDWVRIPWERILGTGKPQFSAPSLECDSWSPYLNAGLILWSGRKGSISQGEVIRASTFYEYCPPLEKKKSRLEGTKGKGETLYGRGTEPGGGVFSR